MKIITSFAALVGLCCVACDDTTEDIGIFTDSDDINASYSVFEAEMRSLPVDSVLSNSTVPYLGRVTDPETGMHVKAEFLAQFNTLEDYRLPDYELMVKNEQGEVEADSIEIRLYYEKFYGDDNNPMKTDVFELDTANAVREDTTYYSNTDFDRYFNRHAAGPIARKVFTTRDFTLEDDGSGSNSYVSNIRIMLPKEYGTFILRKYYENNDFFRNSYNFIRHVCPGFYFRLADGDGTMVKMRVGTMNLYFKYKDTEKDTIYVGMSRFAATPEVLQNTYVENGGSAGLLENDTRYVYLKTPAGSFAEITLPISEIYQGHSNDSISQTQFSLYRYNATESETPFEVPQTVLLVRKQDMHSFFEEGRLPDGKTSYVTTFNSNYNTYTFNNINNLVSFCNKERNEGAVRAGVTAEDWERLHEDWNKVVIIPVEISRNNSDNIVSVTHDMGLGSARLVGGATDKLKIQVIYSTFD